MPFNILMHRNRNGHVNNTKKSSIALKKNVINVKNTLNYNSLKKNYLDKALDVDYICDIYFCPA